VATLSLLLLHVTVSSGALSGRRVTVNVSFSPATSDIILELSFTDFIATVEEALFSSLFSSHDESVMTNVAIAIRRAIKFNLFFMSLFDTNY
jgi:hypothetical protein